MASQNIITFGSCLSRYVARAYKRLYAGEILSSVYHNRSDYFVSTFIDGQQPAVSDDILAPLTRSCDPGLLDEDSRNIVSNQTLSHLGLHKIDRSENLLDTLKLHQIDLILMDNFMDVAARLFTSRSGHMSCFLRPSDYSNLGDHFQLGNYLPPEESAKNFSKILDFFGEHAPQARVCFLHFPFNTYEGDEARRQRSISFLRCFKEDRVHSIPPQSVPRIYRTEVPSHFQEPQYAAYAGMIRVMCPTREGARI